MELNKNKFLPIIKTNVYGKIIYVNKPAIAMSKSAIVGNDMSEIISSDILMKLSMHSKKLDFIELDLPKHKYAIVKISGNGAMKTMEFFFITGEENHDEKRTPRIKAMLELYNNKRSFGSAKEINAYESVKYIVDALSERKFSTLGSIVTDLKNDFSVKMPSFDFEILILTTIFMLNDIKLMGDITITLDKGIISFEAKSKKYTIASNLSELCEVYNFISARALMLMSMCEERKINCILTHNRNGIKLSYDLTSVAKTALVLKSSDISRDARIALFIDTLSYFLG